MVHPRHVERESQILFPLQTEAVEAPRVLRTVSERSRDLRRPSVEFELLRQHEVARLSDSAEIEYGRVGNRSVADQVKQVAHVEFTIQADAAVFESEVNCSQRDVIDIQSYSRSEGPRLGDQRSIRQADV